MKAVVTCLNMVFTTITITHGAHMPIKCPEKRKESLHNVISKGWNVSGCCECWSESKGKSVLDGAVRANLADASAFKYAVTKCADLCYENHMHMGSTDW